MSLPDIDAELAKITSGAVLLDKQPAPFDVDKLVVPLNSDCGCGGANTTGVPFTDIVRGIAGYAWTCDDCGATWAIGVRIEITRTLIGKPSREPGEAPA